MVKYSKYSKYKNTQRRKYKSKIIYKRKLKGGYKTKSKIKSRITKTRRIKKSMRGGNPYISNEIGIHLSKREYDALTSQQRKDLMLYCPDKAPYLCSLESKSYGLCRKTANDCNKIIAKYANNAIPINMIQNDIFREFRIKKNPFSANQRIILFSRFF